MKFKDIFSKFYFLGLIIGPIVLLILPANYFDTGKSVCLSVALFDQECYGCGMTRGVQHLIHMDFATAYVFNKLSYIVFIVLVVLWVREIKKMYNRIFL